MAYVDKQLKAAALRMESGVLMEAVGLERQEKGDAAEAEACFVQARKLHAKQPGQLRQDLHRVAMQRAKGEKDMALLQLKELQKTHKGTAGEAAIQAWIQQLDPPD